MRNLDLVSHPYWRDAELFKGAAMGIPKMMRPAECALLYHLAKDYYQGEGEIADAGVLVGASTHSLASGLMHNTKVKNKLKRIHSFDLFINTAPAYDAFVRNRVARGDSFLHIFLENVRDFSDQINVYPGDFAQRRWVGGSIELMFIDIAKSVALNSHVYLEFSPYWVPGETVVVQQDFVHLFCPQIQYTLAYLWDHFAPIDVVAPSLALAYVKPIPPHKLERVCNDDFSIADKAFLCGELASAIEDREAQGTLRLIKGTLMARGGLIKEAEREVDQVEEEFGDVDDKFFIKRIRDARHGINGARASVA